MKNSVKEAMKLAKELEKIPQPKDEDILKIYKETKESVDRLNKILIEKPKKTTTDKKSSRIKKKTL